MKELARRSVAGPFAPRVLDRVLQSHQSIDSWTSLSRPVNRWKHYTIYTSFNLRTIKNGRVFNLIFTVFLLNALIFFEFLFMELGLLLFLNFMRRSIDFGLQEYFFHGQKTSSIHLRLQHLEISTGIIQVYTNCIYELPLPWCNLQSSPPF